MDDDLRKYAEFSFKSKSGAFLFEVTFQTWTILWLILIGNRKTNIFQLVYYAFGISYKLSIKFTLLRYCMYRKIKIINLAYLFICVTSFPWHIESQEYETFGVCFNVYFIFNGPRILFYKTLRYPYEIFRCVTIRHSKCFIEVDQSKLIFLFLLGH